MFQKLHGTGAQGNMQTFYDGRINVMIATEGVAYSLRVQDTNVHRVVFYDMTMVSQCHSYMHLRKKCANVVHTSTYVVRMRDRCVALSIAQCIHDVSIEHFVCKCHTVFYCDM